MKILLLRPHADDRDISRVMPLGLIAVGSVLKREGYDIRILDLRLSSDPDADLKNTLAEFAPDVVGIGLMTVESDYAFAAARQVKSLKPNVTLIFGGPHCAHEPQFILHDPNVDLMVVGEAELTVVELLAALRDKKELSGIKGIAFKKDGQYVKTAAREKITDLDSLDQNYDLLEVHRYFNFDCSHEYLPATHSFMPIVTSRGCPFTCIYCHDIFGKDIRYRSPEAVIDEMQHMQEAYGVREFHILDDSFNIDMPRAKRIFDMIVERKMDIKISFPNGVRADFFDDEMIEKMSAAGVYRLALGIESGSLRIQKMISKSLDIGILKDVVSKLARARISVNGFFMLGFPGETIDEMKQTIQFACDLDLSTALFSLVIPNPGTALRDMVLEEAETQNANFSDYSINAVNSNASRLEPAELIKLQKQAYRRFYFNPRRAWHIYQTTRSKKLLLSKFLSLLKLTSSWSNRLSYQS
ncbi:MAG: B12-binding domain-containing radical SAM protein [Nitrospinales bacterium]